MANTFTDLLMDEEAQNQAAADANRQHSEERIQIQEENLLNFREKNDRVGEFKTLITLGDLWYDAGDIGKAAHKYQASLNLAEELEERNIAADLLDRLATISYLIGYASDDEKYLDQAVEICQQSIALYNELGDQIGEARSITTLGRVDLVRKRYEQAQEHFEKSLEIQQEVGDKLGQSETLLPLTIVTELGGNIGKAASYRRAYVSVCEELGIEPEDF